MGQSQNRMMKAKSASSSAVQSSSVVGFFAADSFRSKPAEKARPSALSTIALTPASLSSAVRACSISFIITLFSALSCRGRFIAMWPMPCSMDSLMAV